MCVISYAVGEKLNLNELMDKIEAEDIYDVVNLPRGTVQHCPNILYEAIIVLILAASFWRFAIFCYLVLSYRFLMCQYFEFSVTVFSSSGVLL